MYVLKHVMGEYLAVGTSTRNKSANINHANLYTRSEEAITDLLCRAQNDIGHHGTILFQFSLVEIKAVEPPTPEYREVRTL